MGAPALYAQGGTHSPKKIKTPTNNKKKPTMERGRRLELSSSTLNGGGKSKEKRRHFKSDGRRKKEISVAHNREKKGHPVYIIRKNERAVRATPADGGCDAEKEKKSASDCSLQIAGGRKHTKEEQHRRDCRRIITLKKKEQGILSQHNLQESRSGGRKKTSRRCARRARWAKGKKTSEREGGERESGLLRIIKKVQDWKGPASSGVAKKVLAKGERGLDAGVSWKGKKTTSPISREKKRPSAWETGVPMAKHG